MIHMVLHPAAESQVPLGAGWIAAVDQNNYPNLCELVAFEISII
jgi:hypothetical protein